MEKQPEASKPNTIRSTDATDELLSPEELEQVSGGDESPKETTTFEYGGIAIKYGNS